MSIFPITEKRNSVATEKQRIFSDSGFDPLWSIDTAHVDDWRDEINEQYQQDLDAALAAEGPPVEVPERFCIHCPEEIPEVSVKDFVGSMRKPRPRKSQLNS